MEGYFNLKQTQKQINPDEDKPELLLHIWNMYNYNAYNKKLTKDIYEVNVIIDPNNPNHPASNDDSKAVLIDNFTKSTSETPQVLSFIYNMRNLFGEEVAFYFAWVSHYVFTLKYLAFYGMLLFIITITLQLFMSESTTEDYSLYMIIPFTLFVVFIGKIFSEIWIDKEKVYMYKWGMQDYDLDIENSNLKGKVKYNFFLDTRIPIIDFRKMFWKKIIVWIACLIYYLIVIIANLIIFLLQYLLVDKYIDDYNNERAGFFETIFVYIILVLSPYAFLKLRNYFSGRFFVILRKMTIWESHPTSEDHQSSITFKLICFEMVNYYFNLYYTAFIKGYYQSCVFNDCRASSLAIGIGLLHTTQ